MCVRLSRRLTLEERDAFCADAEASMDVAMRRCAAGACDGRNSDHDMMSNIGEILSKAVALIVYHPRQKGDVAAVSRFFGRLAMRSGGRLRAEARLFYGESFSLPAPEGMDRYAAQAEKLVDVLTSMCERREIQQRLVVRRCSLRYPALPPTGHLPRRSCGSVASADTSCPCGVHLIHVRRWSATTPNY